MRLNSYRSLSRLGEVAVLSNVQKPTQRVKENEETTEYVSNKEEDKYPEINFNKMERNDLSSSSK